MKLDVKCQVGGRILDVAGLRGVRGIENLTIFLDVICVSPLRANKFCYNHHKSFDCANTDA